MTENDEHEYGLVMPFVVCASKGGPYDDAAFVAGCRLTHIDHALRAVAEFGMAGYEEYVETGLVPQLDLLAMHLGFVMESEPWDEHPDEWVHVSFARPESGPMGDTQEARE